MDKIRKTTKNDRRCIYNYFISFRVIFVYNSSTKESDNRD